MIEFFLQQELTKRNMPKSELAKATGMRPDTIAAICNGDIKRLPVDGLDRICYTLGCQLSDIMRFTDKEYMVTTKAGHCKYGPATYTDCQQFLNNLDGPATNELSIKQLVH